MIKLKRQPTSAATQPDSAHADRLPSTSVIDRPNDARPRRLPLNQTAISLTMGVQSMDCAAPLSAQSTVIIQ